MHIRNEKEWWQCDGGQWERDATAADNGVRTAGANNLSFLSAKMHYMNMCVCLEVFIASDKFYVL